MGYIVHHAIIVTSWSGEHIGRAHAEALRCFSPRIVSPVLGSVINEYATFCVAPDGSKEGWEDSDEGDARRLAFTAWLRSQRYEDGSSPFEWCEVSYGGDDGDAEVERHACDEGPPAAPSPAPRAPEEAPR